MVMVYSSSNREPFRRASIAYLIKPLFLAASLCAGCSPFSVPVRLWEQAAAVAFVLGVALLALLLAPGLGRRSRRRGAGSRSGGKPAASNS